MTRVKDHYKALGVSPQASRVEILKARNDLLKRFHPDLNPKNLEEAKERTIDILLASDVLLDPSAREKYDKIWRSLFVEHGKKEPPAASRHEPKVSPETDLDFCHYCGHKIYHSEKNYCLFCGAGIGDEPRPFSWGMASNDCPFSEGEPSPPPTFRESCREALIWTAALFLRPFDFWKPMTVLFAVFLVFAIGLGAGNESVHFFFKFGRALPAAFLPAYGLIFAILTLDNFMDSLMSKN